MVFLSVWRIDWCFGCGKSIDQLFTLETKQKIQIKFKFSTRFSVSDFSASVRFDFLLERSRSETKRKNNLNVFFKQFSTFHSFIFDFCLFFAFFLLFGDDFSFVSVYFHCKFSIHFPLTKHRQTQRVFVQKCLEKTFKLELIFRCLVVTKPCEIGGRLMCTSLWPNWKCATTTITFFRCRNRRRWTKTTTKYGQKRIENERRTHIYISMRSLKRNFVCGSSDEKNRDWRSVCARERDKESERGKECERRKNKNTKSNATRTKTKTKSLLLNDHSRRMLVLN